MKPLTPDSAERPTEPVTPDVPGKQVESIAATDFQSAERRELLSLLDPQHAAAPENARGIQDAQNQQRMFERLPTVEGFSFSDRDVSVMEGLREWHERSLRSGRVIGEPSANDVASIL